MQRLPVHVGTPQPSTGAGGEESRLARSDGQHTGLSLLVPGLQVVPKP